MSVIIAESILKDWDNNGLIDPIIVVKDGPRSSTEIIASWKRNGQLWNGEEQENKQLLREVRRVNKKERVRGLSIGKKALSLAKYFWEGDAEGYEATNRVIDGLAWEPIEPVSTEPEVTLGVRLSQEPQELSTKPLIDEATAYWQEVNPWGNGYDEWRLVYKMCRKAVRQEFRKQSRFGWLRQVVNPKREDIHQIALHASLGLIGDNARDVDSDLVFSRTQGVDVNPPRKNRNRSAEDVKTLNIGAKRTVMSLGFAALILGSPAAACYTWNESSELGEVLFSTVHEAGEPEFTPGEPIDSENFAPPVTSDRALGR